MLTKATKTLARHWRARGRSVGVSAGLWGVFIFSLCLAVVSQVWLAASLIVRVLLMDNPNQDGMNSVIAPWESYLTWPPLLLVGLIWMIFIGVRARRDNGTFRQQFLESHGNNPLSRAIASSVKPRSVNEYAQPIKLCLFAAAMAAGMVFAPGVRFEFLPTTLVALLLLASLLALVLHALWWGAYRAHQVAKRFTPAFLRQLLSRYSARSQFENLPAVERGSMVSQAMRSGVDPEGAAFMRAAVADYRSRLAAAQASASSLDASTHGAPELGVECGPVKRF